MKNKTISMVKNTALFLAVVFLVVACGDKKPKQLNYIPKDVSGVVAVDLKKLAIKSLELKDILNADIFTKQLPTQKDTIINKIKNSGVDILNTVYVFGDVAKGEEKNYGAVVFALDDEAKFEALLKNDAKASEVKTDNDIKYTYVGEAIVGWKEKVGIALFIDKETDKEKSKAKLKGFFTQPEENSLSSANDKFKSLLKDEADVSVYVNYEKFGDLIKQNAGVPGLNTANFKDTYLTATVNFENGKIVSDTKLYNNEENHKKAKELYKASVASDLIKAQPGGNVVSFLSFAINTEPVVKYLQEANLLEGINQNLKSLDPSFDANYIAAALSGDVIATLNSLSVKEVQKMDYMTGEMKPGKDIAYDYAITIGLKDAAKFQKILDAVVAKGGLAKVDKYYTASGFAFIVPKSNSIVIVNTEALAKEVVDGKTTALAAPDADLIGANTATFGFDLSKVKPEVLDFIDKDANKISTALPFESLYISAEEVKGDAVTSKTVLNFKNKEQNSLVSLQQTIKEADKFMPSRTAYEEAIPDSSVVLPPSEVPVEEAQ